MSFSSTIKRSYTRQDQDNPELDSKHDAETTENPDEILTAIPIGTALDNAFLFEEKVDSVNHADIYRVKALASAGLDMTINYQARVFRLEGVSPRLKAYRSRAMRRLSRRSVLHSFWQGLHVVIYKTGDLDHRGRRIGGVEEEQEQAKPPKSTAESVKKQRIKTTQQRESNRQRQQSRRKRNRQRRHLETSQEEGSDPTEESSVFIDIDEDDFVFFNMLHLIRGDGSFRQQFRSSNRQAVENYLAAKDREVALDDEDALADYISLKEREMVYLCRQHNKYQPVLKNWQMHLNDMLRQQERVPLGSMEQKKYWDERVVPLNLRCLVLQSDLSFLPNHIAGEQERIKLLTSKLALARQAKEERDIKQAAKVEKKKLTKKAKNYRVWIHDIIPGTAPHSDALRDLASVEDKLTKLDLASI